MALFIEKILNELNELSLDDKEFIKEKLEKMISAHRYSSDFRYKQHQQLYAEGKIRPYHTHRGIN